MFCVEILGVCLQDIKISNGAKSIAMNSLVQKFWNIPENVLKIDTSTSGSKKIMCDFVYSKKNKYSKHCQSFIRIRWMSNFFQRCECLHLCSQAGSHWVQCWTKANFPCFSFSLFTLVKKVVHPTDSYKTLGILKILIFP